MPTVEEHLGEAVDLLAANPNLTVDPRAWRQLFIYAPSIFHDEIDRLRAEVQRFRIRMEESNRATREECARAAESFETHIPGTAWIMEGIAAAIRAEEK